MILDQDHRSIFAPIYFFRILSRLFVCFKNNSYHLGNNLNINWLGDHCSVIRVNFFYDLLIFNFFFKRSYQVQIIFKKMILDQDHAKFDLRS
jgi:hypothetical protein